MWKAKQQSGAALLIVLTLVAVLTILASELYAKSRHNGQRQSSLQNLLQAQWYARGGENHALLIAGKLSDYPIPEPEQLTSSYPIDKGHLRIQLIPQHNCFNLNSLDSTSTDDNKVTDNQDRPTAINTLKRLLQASGTDSHTGNTFTSRLADWIDKDSQPLDSFGMERASINTPHPNNAQLLNINEIKQLKILDDKAYNQLKKHLCTRSGDSGLAINPNDLTSENIPLLQAVFGDKLTPQTLEQLIESRPPDGYKDAEDFFNQSVFEDTDISAEVKAAFTTERKYYQAKINVSYDLARVQLNILLSSDEQNSNIIARYYGVTP